MKSIQDFKDRIAQTTLTQQRLKSLLHYDKIAGLFFWRVNRGSATIGKIAGSERPQPNGPTYVIIKIDRAHFYAHRLAWLYVTGKWPKSNIDHFDGRGTNNSWDNLRDASQGTNLQNLRKATLRSSTGLLGVERNGKRYASRISVNKKRLYLGTFQTAKEAHAAYIAAKRRLHGGNTL